jgi:hypothetical protein
LIILLAVSRLISLLLDFCKVLDGLDVLDDMVNNFFILNLNNKIEKKSICDFV